MYCSHTHTQVSLPKSKIKDDATALLLGSCAGSAWGGSGLELESLQPTDEADLNGEARVSTGLTVVLLETTRQLLGIPHAPLGPDWWVYTGLGIAIALPVAIIGILYWRCRKHWEHRLRDVWQTGIPAHAKIHRLRPAAGEGELQRRIEYLGALRGTPGWAAAAHTKFRRECRKL